MNKLIAWIRISPSVHAGLAAGFAIALVGCDRNEVKVYKVAKESPAPASTGMAALPPMNADAALAQPQLIWTLPDGWQEVTPGQMRLASFMVAGQGGKKADVSIVTLGGMAGGELGNVNRWRGQVGLAPVAADEVSKLAEKVTAAGSETKLFDLAGTAASGDKVRILVVALERGDASWFFKMTGDDELVAVQKPVFLAFLQSLKFSAAPAGTAAPTRPVANAELPADHPPLGGPAGVMPAGHPPMGATQPVMASAGEQAGKPAWKVPSGWTEEPPTQMLLAKFSATQASARAEITVSVFPGDVGGLTANVNRWRRQIGLAAVEEAAVAQMVKPIEVGAEKGSLVDLTGTDPKTGQPARLIGVAVPLDGQTWFFKLVGEAPAATREQDAFIQFVQSTKLPHAH